jgi:hypothetical protein
MKRGSLLATNPFLRDRARYRDDLVRSVATSTAIETGESVESIARDLRRFFDAGMPALKPHRRRR